MEMLKYITWLITFICQSQLVDTSTCCRRLNTTLDCTKCKLTTLPFDLMDNTVTDLLLNGNSITHIPDGSFGNFTSLRSLALIDNPLEGLNKETFKGLGSLKHLELGSKSDISPQLTSDALSAITNVTNLTLYYRYPVELPSKVLENLKELESLCIALAPHAILGEEFKELHKLKTLRLLPVRDNFREMTEKTFAAVPHIHTLHIEESLHFVHPDALKHFTKLSTLSLIFNYFPTPQAFDAIKNMRAPTLENLILDGSHTQNFLELNSESFNSSNFANLSYLSLKSTHLTVLDETFLYKLANLTRCSFGFNTVWYNHPFDDEAIKFIKLSKIEAIDIRYFARSVAPVLFKGMYHTNSLATFPNPPKFIRRTKPHLLSRKLVTTGNLTGTGTWRFVPPSLRYIYASHATSLAFVVKREHFNVPANNILYIDFSHTKLTKVPLLKGLKQLQGVDLNSCGIMSIHTSQLYLLPSLIHLNVSNNNLNQLNQMDLAQLISGGSQLKVLDVSKNNLQTLISFILSNMTALEHVSFRGNPLLAVTLVLSKNTKLKMLDLSDCTLANLTDEFIHNMDDLQSNMNHTLRVDLSGNRFDCSCDTLSMIHWFQQTKVNVLNRDSINCKYKDILTPIMALNFNKISEECARARALMLMNILTPIGVFFLLLLVFILVYQFRWQLRWQMYKSRRAIRLYFAKLNEENLLMEMQQQQQMNHAFISYNHAEDYDWVANELLPKVEEEWGLRLCVGQRDFEAGKPISENIVDAIDNSRRTVLVITPAFVSSEWCDFEMHMALVKGRSSIIIVYKEEVPVEDMSKTLRALMKSINYIEYDSDLAQRGVFWEKLRSSLTKA